MFITNSYSSYRNFPLIRLTLKLLLYTLEIKSSLKGSSYNISRIYSKGIA